MQESYKTLISYHFCFPCGRVTAISYCESKYLQKVKRAMYYPEEPAEIYNKIYCDSHIANVDFEELCRREERLMLLEAQQKMKEDSNNES